MKWILWAMLVFGLGSSILVFAAEDPPIKIEGAAVLRGNNRILLQTESGDFWVPLASINAGEYKRKPLPGGKFVSVNVPIVDFIRFNRMPPKKPPHLSRKFMAKKGQNQKINREAFMKQLFQKRAGMAPPNRAISSLKLPHEAGQSTKSH